MSVQKVDKVVKGLKVRKAIYRRKTEKKSRVNGTKPRMISRLKTQHFFSY